MSLIKEINIKGNILNVIDKNDKKYSISVFDKKISQLLPLASNSSKKTNKWVRYYEKYFIICIVCALVSLLGIAGSLAFFKYTYDLLVLGYGLLALGSVSLAVISKLYIKHLKKESVNNEYWNDIYYLVKNYNPDIEKCYQTVKQKKNEINKNNINLSYSYRKEDIIQDYPEKVKVKTYKKM